jgi:hypothetical protein
LAAAAVSSAKAGTAKDATQAAPARRMARKVMIFPFIENHEASGGPVNLVDCSLI